MAFNFFFTAATVCLTALFFSVGYAYPQQLSLDKPPPKQEPVSEICLDCICEAISSCNPNLICDGTVCGMFRMKPAYWIDSGKPTIKGNDPNDGLAYTNCAKDMTCARKAVTGYVTRYAKDCDRNGVINCLDYAAIHKLGGNGCSSFLDQEYKTKYDQCQRSAIKNASLHSLHNSKIIFPDQLFDL